MANQTNNIFSSILDYKIIIVLIIGIFTLIGLIVVFSIVDFLISVISLSILFEMLSSLLTFFAIFTALTIPFVMKDIERKKEKEIEKKSLETILERVKEYLYLQEPSAIITNYPASELPYFVSLSVNFPHLLIKLGIEVQTITHQTKSTEMKTSYLHIIDKYRLWFSKEGLRIDSPSSYGEYKSVVDITNIKEKIIEAMKIRAKNKFGILL